MKSAELRLKEFAETVRAMRAHQREYFKSRSNTSLEASKAAEKRVDAAVKEILEPSLFKGDDDAKA